MASRLTPGLLVEVLGGGLLLDHAPEESVEPVVVLGDERLEGVQIALPQACEGIAGGKARFELHGGREDHST